MAKIANAYTTSPTATGNSWQCTPTKPSFFDENGKEVGTGQFGGHGDCPTHLAYGNKMFVGVVAIHMTGDGIGASFLDSNGNHLIDIMPLEMPESPGWAAYDW